MSTSLRPAVPSDTAWLDSWLAGVAASAGYDGFDREAGAVSLLGRLRGERTLRVRVIECDGAEAGCVVFRLRSPARSAAMFEIVAKPAGEARRGAGMRAAALAEDEMRSAGARRIYAPAAAAHGISVYFWIRLGYRPLPRGEWPCARDGFAWLMREI